MKLIVTVFVIAMSLFSTSASAQWNGGTSTTGTIGRTGNVGVGLTNPPSDTKLYVRSNLKVGIVSEVNQSTDFGFGVLSVVNRETTKAFSVLLLDRGSYVDKFAVLGDGTVLAEEVIVQVPIFPDYVFEPTYDLMTLSELERFISKNKHLPNIPSSKEVIESGLNLGDMQVKQMEKIEELFLYTIELKKEIEELRLELRKVRAEND